jgi:hypothetical protein
MSKRPKKRRQRRAQIDDNQTGAKRTEALVRAKIILRSMYFTVANFAAAGLIFVMPRNGVTNIDGWMLWGLLIGYFSLQTGSVLHLRGM